MAKDGETVVDFILGGSKITVMVTTPMKLKDIYSWDFFGRNDAIAETPVLWPPHVKS